MFKTVYSKHLCPFSHFSCVLHHSFSYLVETVISYLITEFTSHGTELSPEVSIISVELVNVHTDSSLNLSHWKAALT